MDYEPEPNDHKDAALVSVWMLIVLLVVLAICSGCTTWEARRSYSIFVEDEQGRRAGAGVIIEPMKSAK